MNLFHPIRSAHVSGIKKIIVCGSCPRTVCRHAKSVESPLSRTYVLTLFSCLPHMQEQASSIRPTAPHNPTGSNGVSGSGSPRLLFVSLWRGRRCGGHCREKPPVVLFPGLWPHAPRFVLGGSSTPWSTSCGSAAGTSQPQTYVSCHPVRSSGFCWTFSSLSRTEGKRGLGPLQDTLHYRRHNFDM